MANKGKPIRRRDRLRRTRPRSAWAWVGAAGTCTIPPVILFAAGAPGWVVLGAVPVLLGVVTLTFQEWRPRSKSHDITLIGKSKKGAFSESVMLGLREALEKEIIPNLVEIEPATLHESGTLAFQLEALRESKVRESEAVVVIPAGDYEELWEEVRQLTESGVFVVLIDVKAPNRLFYSHGLPMPRFVTSDFRLGGELVGRFIASKLETGSADAALVLGGPAFSPPATIRNLYLLNELLSFGGDRLYCGDLDSWDEEAAIRCFKELAERLDARPSQDAGNIVVFCGNDRNCSAIGRFLKDNSSGLVPDRYELIGYDGVRDSGGTLFVADVDCCSATVDTGPRSQGRSAAGFVLDGYDGRPDAHRKNAIIAPRLLQRPYWT